MRNRASFLVFSVIVGRNIKGFRHFFLCAPPRLSARTHALAKLHNVFAFCKPFCHGLNQGLFGPSVTGHFVLDKSDN